MSEPARALSFLSLLALWAIASAAIAADHTNVTERLCRDWADSFFATSTAAKAREIAKCIAARDPDSVEARDARAEAERERVADAERERVAEAQRLRRAESDDADARARCGGDLIPALGPLCFCDSPEAVKRRVSNSDVLECAGRDACKRLRLTKGPVPLTAYPKYFEGGLYHIALYAPKRSHDEFDTTLRSDWERVVSLAETEYGPATEPPTRFPPFFAVDGAHIATTHHWTLGRKRVGVGVFTSREGYAATLTVEDGRAVARKEQSD